MTTATLTDRLSAHVSTRATANAAAYEQLLDRCDSPTPPVPEDVVKTCEKLGRPLTQLQADLDVRARRRELRAAVDARGSADKQLAAARRSIDALVAETDAAMAEVDRRHEEALAPLLANHRGAEQLLAAAAAAEAELRQTAPASRIARRDEAQRELTAANREVDRFREGLAAAPAHLARLNEIAEEYSQRPSQITVRASGLDVQVDHLLKIARDDLAQANANLERYQATMKRIASTDLPAAERQAEQAAERLAQAEADLLRV